MIDQSTIEVAPTLRCTQTHFTVGQLAKKWGLSDSTVLRLFKMEPGVMRIGNINSRKRAKVSLRIPEDVAERVHAKLTGL